MGVTARRRSILFMMVVLAGVTSASAVTGQSDQGVVRVQIETAEGVIGAEIYVNSAPITARNFLAYTDDGVFDGGSFFRSVRMDNQPNDSVRIEVIQGGPDRGTLPERLNPPIPLERTELTGLRHVDGALSMARGGPDSGQSQFFICIGDQPSLDFGGNRNLDGQGFAVFGRVISGMDVVRRIQMSTVDAQQLVDPVSIRRIRREEPGALAPG
jgi:peptidyl-prolyl cis-trans isomerase A (cyclophilin A)